MKRLLIHHNYKKDSMAVKARLLGLMEQRGFQAVDENPDVIRRHRRRWDHAQRRAGPS